MQRIIVINLIAALLSDAVRPLRAIGHLAKRINEWVNHSPAVRVPVLKVAVMLILLIAAGPLMGCGGGVGEFLATVLCGPCAIPFIIGGVIATAFFIDWGGDGNQHRPPPHYQPPPDDPVEPMVNQIFTHISSGAKCGIDGVGVNNRFNPVSAPAWNYGGPQAVFNPEKGYYEGVGEDRMIYPYNDYSKQRWGLNNGHERHANPVWTVNAGVSEYSYGAMGAAITFHFANGDELYVNWDFDGSGAPIEFLLDWNNDQPILIGVFDHGSNTTWHPPFTIALGPRE